MKLLVQFDVDADLVDVPEYIVTERDLYRRRFWKWLNNPSVRHKYWVEVHNNNGNSFTGLQYRGDAFVEWLNKKVLRDSEEKASVVAANIDGDDLKDTCPCIFF